MVFNVILLPPALGPDITIICCSWFRFNVCGIVSFCKHLLVSNNMGWKASFKYIFFSLLILGKQASICLA